MPSPVPASDLLKRMADNDKQAHQGFYLRFEPLALTLARRVLPTPGSSTLAREIARRGLEICVEQLPLVTEALAQSDQRLEAWVAIVCARFFHEIRSQVSASARERELLPRRMPDSEYFELKAYYRPAEWLSGDYYDVLKHPDGSIRTLIADVMGHGAPAGLLVSAVKCAFRVSAGRRTSADILRGMNDALHGVIPDSCFVAASVLLLGPPEGDCKLANAGMEGATLVSRSARRVESMEIEQQFPVEDET